MEAFSVAQFYGRELWAGMATVNTNPIRNAGNGLEDNQSNLRTSIATTERLADPRSSRSQGPIWKGRSYDEREDGCHCVVTDSGRRTL